MASTALTSAEDKPFRRIVSGSNLSATPRTFNNAEVKQLVADLAYAKSEIYNCSNFIITMALFMVVKLLNFNQQFKY